jgi:catechol 2,3-dioxygenase-like lactoylglutathione lyase family enzyme
MADRPTLDNAPVVTDGGADWQQPPAPINHIGITVPDIEAAVEWYQDILGFSVISEPAEVPPDSGHFADLFVDIINEYDGVKQAHLESANGVGFELFEYASTEDRENPRSNIDENWQAAPGIHHFAVTHPNIEELIDRLEAAGGEQHSAQWTLIPDQPYELVYVVDPWGNMWEVFNRSYAQFFASQ